MTMDSYHDRASQRNTDFPSHDAQRGDALALLQSLPNSCTPLVFFDPQYWGVLDKLPIRAELSGDRRCSTLGIVVNAYAPVLTLARRLIRAGLPPDRILEVYRGATLCFRVPLAVAARLTVKDDKDGVPRFKNYVPFPADRVTPPIAPNDLAEPLQKTPSAERANEALAVLESSCLRGGSAHG